MITIDQRLRVFVIDDETNLENASQMGIQYDVLDYDIDPKLGKIKGKLNHNDYNRDYYLQHHHEYNHYEQKNKDTANLLNLAHQPHRHSPNDLLTMLMHIELASSYGKIFFILEKINLKLYC